MVWNAQNLLPWSAGNYAAYSGPNYAAYTAPNYAAYTGPNYAAHTSPNYAAYSAPNDAAYTAPSHAAQMPAPGVPLEPRPATGAGGASGRGFLGGYGPVARSEYATPAALGGVPWSLDFAVGNGWPGFPVEQRLNPYALAPALQYQPGDWDPGLRFWTLPFDDQLTEWLQDLNLGAPAVMAAREYAARDNNALWLAIDPDLPPVSDLQARLERDDALMGWRQGARLSGQTQDAIEAWRFIDSELTELVDLMRDDRVRYLPEVTMQSSHIVPYFIQLMAIDPASKPWTMELMNCATAIANLTKMQYKSVYRRLRPSILCPGLAPPWGPPQHPAFPSGHSLVAHLTALFLLSVPGIAARFGIFREGLAIGETPHAVADFIAPNAPRYGQNQRSALLWLAWRVAKGRERLGLHYPSDSAASRQLAAGVWDLCLGAADTGRPLLRMPTLRQVLHRAEAEWPATAAAATLPGVPVQAAAGKSVSGKSASGKSASGNTASGQTRRPRRGKA